MSVKYEWDLTSFYQGFDDPDFQKDMSQLDRQYKKTKKIQEEILLKKEKNPVSDLKEILSAIYEWKMKYGKLREYISLRSILAKNDEQVGESCRIFWGILRGYDKEIFYQNLDRYLEVIPDLENVIKEDSFLWDNRNFLKRQKEELVRVASDEDLALWDTIAKELAELSLTEIIDKPCFLWEGKEVSAYEIYEKKVNVPSEVSKEFMQSVYEKAADCLMKNKKAALFNAEMYGFQGVLELILEDGYMQLNSFFALWEVLEAARPLFDEYKGAQKKYDRWIEEHWTPEWEQKIKEAPIPSKEEEIEQLMDKIEECFKNICPSFVDFTRNSTENGWVDFYERPEKKMTTSQYECFCIKSIGESRITIHGMQGLLSFIDDNIVHEFGHAFGAHLGREDTILDKGSGILQEVFPIYAEIVVDRYYELQKKKQYEQQELPLLVKGLDAICLRWPNTVFEYADQIAREEKLYAMMDTKELLDEQKISELYGGHGWVFDCMLVETEHSSVRYLIATVLALAFDKKVRKQGNIFMQEDMDSWRDVPKLTVEEFVERLTGETCTKQMWAQMIEESLLEPMRRYIKVMESLTS